MRLKKIGARNGNYLKYRSLSVFDMTDSNDKRCTKCNTVKPLDLFYKNNKKNRYFSSCKICYNKQEKERKDKNRDEINKKARKQYKKRMATEEGRKRKRENWKKAAKKAYKKLRSTPEGRKQIKVWSAKARKQPGYLRKVEENRKKRYQSDPKFVMCCRLRGRIHHALKGKTKVATTLKLTGCSWDFLMQHIESQFVEGMSWENRHLWHLDHIRPCSSFNLLEESEQRECFHYSNLQPLWAQDNLKKGSTYKK